MEKNAQNSDPTLTVSPAFAKSRKRIPVFETTVHKSKEWIAEMQDQLEWMSATQLYHLLRAVLQTLRDQLNINEAAQFAAQLPILLKGTFYEAWNPSELPPKPLNKDDFLFTLQTKLDLSYDPEFDIEHGLRVAMSVITKHVSAGEIEDVLAGLKPSVKEMLLGGRAL
jgi:uncharacterized protein (DUF2267 family)